MAEVGDTPVVILWLAGQDSALEDANTAGARDVDTETSSTWGITGRAVSGPLAAHASTRSRTSTPSGSPWSTYEPETTLFES